MTDWDFQEEEDRTTSVFSVELERDLLEKNIIVIHGELDEKLCNRIAKECLILEEKKPKHVKIILNTVGGEVYHALLVYNSIRSLVLSGAKVTIEVRGLAASAGAIILQAGSERIAHKWSRFMLHEVGAFEYGKCTELQEQSTEVAKLNEMVLRILAERTGKKLKTLKKLVRKKDYWMSAEEALKFGLIDKVL